MSSNPELATAADLHAATTAILAKIADSEKGSRRSSLTPLLLQIVLSAIIGFLVWRAQTSISQGIQDANSRLANQLALSQDYFKERMKVYADLYRVALTIRDVARQTQSSPELRDTLSDAIVDLHKTKNADYLYASENLLDLSEKLWTDGIKVYTNQDQGKALKDIEQLVTEIGTQMRVELAIKALEAVEARLAADVDLQAKRQKARR